MNKKRLAAIILAAGKGTRMNSKSINKVALPLRGKPMILYEINLLQKLLVSPIIVVVGFGKNSITRILKKNVVYAEQKKQLGTAHAVSFALKKVPDDVLDVLVIQGDDAVFYCQKEVAKVIESLIRIHFSSSASISFLTIHKEDSSGLGRIIRDKDGNVKAIVEEKNVTPSQKKIKEINPACYIFRVDFLRKYIPELRKNEVSQEYYLTDLIEMAYNNNEAMKTLSVNNLYWRGVNTFEELHEAESFLLHQTTK